MKLPKLPGIPAIPALPALPALAKRLPNKLPRLSLSGWRIWAMAAVVAGIVHILVTLATAQFTGQPGYASLARQLPLHKFAVLAAVAPGSQPLPFWSPDFRYAVCRFDAGRGSVLVSATLPDGGWTLSIFSSDGVNAYSVAGQAGRTSEINLQLLPPGEKFLGIAQDAVASQAGGLALPVNVREGIVIIRAPLKGFSYRAGLEADLRRAQCTHRPQ